MKEGFLETRGISYRYSDLDPQRLTLLFVHGAGSSASQLYPLEERLKDRFNIINVDLRGHGNSKRYGHYGDYTFENYAQDTTEVLRHFGALRVIAVGYSLGTIVVQTMVAKKMYAFEGTVLLSTNIGVHELPRARIFAPFLIALSQLLSVLPFHSRKRGRVDYRKFKHIDEWSPRRIYIDSMNTGLRVYLYVLHRIYSCDCSSLWKQHTLRSLIIHGEDDRFIPLRHVQKLLQSMAGAEFKVLPKGNHFIVLNNASEVTEHINHFADSLPQRG